ncbi:hypothetical protein [Enterococcus casseliflavus]|uniref:hypothetical protein n=1 Tax=Enterococcus casseliflavus TaxID=37734 RepID=UPI003D6BC413
MSNKELVVIKERLKAEHKKHVEQIKQNGDRRSFDESQSFREVNKETYFEFFNLSE